MRKQAQRSYVPEATQQKQWTGVSTHVDWDQLFVTIVTKLLHYLYAGKNFTQISVASVITEIAKH